MMIAHARDPVVPPSQVRAGIPDDLERVVLRCLAKDRPSATWMPRAWSEPCASAPARGIGTGIVPPGGGETPTWVRRGETRNHASPRWPSTSRLRGGYPSGGAVQVRETDRLGRVLSDTLMLRSDDTEVD